ncbi:MAG: hypothetical protein ACP5GX_10350 [Anaerolineae bacterium]
MIRDREAWEAFEARFQRQMPADLEKNQQLFATWLAEARALGVWPPDDPLEGLEVDLRIAKAVNTYVRTTPQEPR